MKLIFQLLIITFSISSSSCSSSKKTTAAASTSPNSTAAPAQAATATANDGSSFEKAIIVKSISEEYAYIKKVCTGCRVTKQALRSNNKKYYDVLYVDNNGKEEIYYFDINSFFGKSF